MERTVYALAQEVLSLVVHYKFPREEVTLFFLRFQDELPTIPDRVQYFTQRGHHVYGLVFGQFDILDLGRVCNGTFTYWRAEHVVFTAQEAASMGVEFSVANLEAFVMGAAQTRRPNPNHKKKHFPTDLGYHMGWLEIPGLFELSLKCGMPVLVESKEYLKVISVGHIKSWPHIEPLTAQEIILYLDGCIGWTTVHMAPSAAAYLLQWRESVV